ncbi:hypothetical protein CDAR_408811 [Caerostris darwini]|uniref:Uncharacterized protein n=1 Tax=Caerostris darwini TaxID=1538125 RepID=A0AAV4MDB4_9ARAC|nr:hypothetical protein CDAR_408811 [Caerostris darwini]
MKTTCFNLISALSLQNTYLRRPPNQFPLIIRSSSLNMGSNFLPAPVSPAFRRTMIADRSRNVPDALMKVSSHSRGLDKPIFIARNQRSQLGNLKAPAFQPDKRPQSRINFHLVCLQIAFPAA